MVKGLFEKGGEMANIHQQIKCTLCGSSFKLHTSENEEANKELRNFVSALIPEGKYWEMMMCKVLMHEESDLIYGLCSHCCGDILKQILSQMINRQRKILFRKFTEE